MVRCGLAAALAIAPFGAAPAFASHGYVQTQIQVFRDGVLVWQSLINTSACGTSCTVYVTVDSKRDLGRFTRWCQGTSKNVVVASGTSVRQEECIGPSTWFIRITVYPVYWTGSSYSGTTHTGDITVTVVPQLPT